MCFSEDALAVAQFQPALGAIWQHNVNIRIVLGRDEANGRFAVIGKRYQQSIFFYRRIDAAFDQEKVHGSLPQMRNLSSTTTACVEVIFHILNIKKGQYIRFE